MREWIDNDGMSKHDREYEQYLKLRKEIDDAYLNNQKQVVNQLASLPLEEAVKLQNNLLTFTHSQNEMSVSDPVVQSVIDKFRSRHLVGMKTYGVTLADNPASTLEWINHAQEELMDGILYLERLKSAIKD